MVEIIDMKTEKLQKRQYVYQCSVNFYYNSSTNENDYRLIQLSQHTWT